MENIMQNYTEDDDIDEDNIGSMIKSIESEKNSNGKLSRLSLFDLKMSIIF